jgi:hypothetical protein
VRAQASLCPKRRRAALACLIAGAVGLALPVGAQRLVDPSEDPAAGPPPGAGWAAPAEPATLSEQPVRGPVRLVYAAGPWAEVCPSAWEVTAQIREHLGRDPFGEPARRVVVILLDTDADDPEAQAPEPVRARVELLDDDLVSLGSRTMTSPEGCAELVKTATLQTALALDPWALVQLPPALATPPAERLEPVPLPAPAAVAEPAARARLDPYAEPTMIVSASAHGAGLLTPEGAMMGAIIGVGGRWQWLSGRVEGRVDIPGDSPTTALPLLASLVPCAHLALLPMSGGDYVGVLLCGTATAGAVGALGVYNGLGAYAGAGTRLGLEWQGATGLSGRAFLQVEGGLLRPRFASTAGNVFETPPFNGLVGLGVDLPWL